MQTYKTELDNLAASIQAKANLIESKRQDEIAIDDEMQTLKMSEMMNVMTARFEVNNKLMYTNDDQRKAALQAALDANEDYQNLKSARSVKIVERVLLESEVEFQRKSFRALELQMLYHANNPTT
jgi:glycerol-3-phosphate cytidylyltransferase-like family protein